jgi:hypothetical protein
MPGFISGPIVQRRQRLHHLHRLQAHRDDLAEEADDVFGGVGAVGSLVMPLRLSVLTWYWSITHSRAERLPKRYSKAPGGMPSRSSGISASTFLPRSCRG